MACCICIYIYILLYSVRESTTHKEQHTAQKEQRWKKLATSAKKPGRLSHRIQNHKRHCTLRRTARSRHTPHIRTHDTKEHGIISFSAPRPATQTGCASELKRRVSRASLREVFCLSLSRTRVMYCIRCGTDRTASTRAHETLHCVCIVSMV